MHLPKKQLTRAEWAIFDTLASAKEKVVSIDTLIDALPERRSERTSYNDGNLIAVHVMNLRKKLLKTQEIQTVRGAGYRLVSHA